MLQAWLSLNVSMAGTLQGGFFPRVPHSNKEHVPLPAGVIPLIWSYKCLNDPLDESEEGVLGLNDHSSLKSTSLSLCNSSH